MNGVPKAVMVLLLVAAGFTALTAQGAEALRLDSAIGKALQSNPELQSQRLSRDRQRIETSIARRERLPSAEFRASHTGHSNPTLVHPIDEAGVFPTLDRRISDAGVYLKLPLYVGGKLVAGESLAEHRLRASHSDLRASRQDLIFNVVATFVKAQQMRSLSRAHEERVRSLEAELRDMERKLRRGHVAKVAMLRVRAQLSQARLDRANSRRAEQDARDVLAVLLNREQVAEPLVPASLNAAGSPDSADKAATVARQNHPVLERLRAELAAAQDQMDIARADQRPRVDLTANARTARDSDWEGRDDWQVGVAISMPLFDGGIRRRRVDQAQLERERLRHEFESAAANIAAEARQAYGALRTAEQRISVARTGLAQAKEALRIEKLAYREGRSTVTDLLSAEAAHSRAITDLNETEYELIVARTRLLRAQGSLTPERLGMRTPSTEAGRDAPNELPSGYKVDFLAQGG